MHDTAASFQRVVVNRQVECAGRLPLEQVAEMLATAVGSWERLFVVWNLRRKVWRVIGELELQ
jgi:hypothetical protein